MNGQEETPPRVSRRGMLRDSAIFLLGGALGCGSTNSLAVTKAPANGGPPPLPWSWPKLDPMEAGRRSYRAYLEKRG